jgi:hypothetical protein
VDEREGDPQRIFIPGKITDHNLLGPEYIANLQMSGSPELVRAWLEGDWDVIAGAYFPEFSRGRHVLEPMEFPRRLAALHRDRLGLGAPVLDRLVRGGAEGDEGAHHDGAPVTLLPGALVCYREWYGEQTGEARGAQPRPEAAGRGVGGRRAQALARRRDRLRHGRHLDVRRGWRAVARRARGKVRLNGKKLRLRKADKQRLPGWNQVRYRLVGEYGDMKGRRCSSSLMGCPDAIRTLAALQHDDVESKFEDADTDGEDHPPDGIRYGCQSRPRKLPDPADRFAGQPKKGTMEWLTTEAWKGQKMPGLSRRPLG